MILRFGDGGHPFKFEPGPISFESFGETFEGNALDAETVMVRRPKFGRKVWRFRTDGERLFATLPRRGKLLPAEFMVVPSDHLESYLKCGMIISADLALDFVGSFLTRRAAGLIGWQAKQIREELSFQDLQPSLRAVLNEKRHWLLNEELARTVPEGGVAGEGAAHLLLLALEQENAFDRRRAWDFIEEHGLAEMIGLTAHRRMRIAAKFAH